MGEVTLHRLAKSLPALDHLHREHRFLAGRVEPQSMF